MTIRNLPALLQPSSVAFVGASTRPGSIGNILARNLLSAGFNGPIRLVNPKQPVIDGTRCFADIASLPETPELAVIATPPQTIPGLVAELGARGTRAAVVISAGVTRELRQAMLDAAQPHLLRVQGPNCLGLMVPHIGLNASFCHRQALDGDLALVSQSGAIVTALVDWASSRGIGFSHVVSVGDMADVDFGDMLDFLAGDIRSRAILLYMEQLTNAPKFMSAARRAARAKPVVILKSGRHAAGAKAAMSHTGALAGSDAAYDAAFRRAGLVRVLILDELFEAAEILSRSLKLDGERIALLTNGGGAGVLAADRLADVDGTLAQLSPETLARLSAHLPATWSHGNPVDIIGDADGARYQKAMEVLLAAPEVDALLVMNCPTALSSSTDIARDVLETHARLGGPSATKPVLANWLGDGAVHEARQLLASKGIPAFDTPAAAVEGFMHLARYSRAQTELMRVPPPVPEGSPADLEAARSAIAGALAQGRDMLTELESKALMSAYGIPVVPTRKAATPQEVGTLAAGLLQEHAACVLKILSDDITHKSDVGGVHLDISTPEEAVAAAQAMLQRIARAMPKARIAGFTVQPMIRRPRAHELLIGMTEDPTFGPILMFGAGGTSVEVVRDTAQALPPLDLLLAREMIARTRLRNLLEGYRDRPRADIDAIALTLTRLSALVVAHPQIREIDINPLLADETGVIALDARVRVADERVCPRVPMAVRPYPSHWEKPDALAGIGDIVLRPIRPEDEPRYRVLLDRIEPEDKRLRFFTARPDLSLRLIARFTQIDYAREMAFVAETRPGGDLLGIARLVADPDYRRAEYAVVVASDLKGKGLGWRLMQHLIDYARAEHLQELHGLVLAENTTMLRMCAELGFHIANDPEDTSLRAVVLPLA
ncbi:MAG: bifunctional acetate--CoA ligase family protein/GNAT family N-acetyltransferase [Hyphomicrobiaceae bacterium]